MNRIVSALVVVVVLGASLLAMPSTAQAQGPWGYPPGYAVERHVYRYDRLPQYGYRGGYGPRVQAWGVNYAAPAYRVYRPVPAYNPWFDDCYRPRSRVSFSFGW